MDFLKSCEDLYTVCRIPLTIVTAAGEPLLGLPGPHDELIPRRAVHWVLTDFLLQKRDTLHPLVTYVEPGYFIGVAALPQEQFCIVGLVSPFQHPRREILQLASQAIDPQHLQAFCDLMAQIPLVNLHQLKSLLCLIVRLAHGQSITAENILFVDNTSARPADLNGAMFELREEAAFHIPVDFESGVCSAVENGDAEMLQRRLLQPSQGKIGRMSSSPLQQQKYSFISFATLLSRAAIRGGLDSETAFNLSDVYCQRVDAQMENEPVQKLSFTMAMDFCNRVADTKKSGAQSVVVKNCLQYISTHLHEDLRLEELAHECGLCSRSLSLKFKAEVGCGISEYIHREKLREARYLLTHTDYSLSDIAGFLNYPTQSYFTQIFKRYEGRTPQQYRDNPRGA